MILGGMKKITVIYKCVKKFKQKELNNWHHPLEEIKEFLKLRTNRKKL